ncbi:murein biosynthesis integral membrane protein MurJ [Rubrobacter marinus]|uniref:Probable lipid II flippase MurJ n=2 Tax=Rubrobacter marinus TaxID=2653852 RepID=A0A6G8PUE2_9ACTN|nr:murein biosynthesis integral membrane protein MurJ [Rubrobacter marinus]
MTGMLRAVLSISAATVLSRVTGYARIMAQAAVLGAGYVADAYTVAALLPTLIYELFLGGILYSIFIPVLVERITNHGEDDAKRLTDTLFTFVVPLMVVAAGLGIVFARPLVSLATDWGAQNLTPEEAAGARDLATFFFRIFALQMLFYGLNTIATGVLQAHRRFFLPTFAPVLNNLLIIASFVAYWLLVDANRGAAEWTLAIGVTVGVAVMALALVPTMLELGYKPRPRLRHPALAPTVRLAGPMLVLVAASVGFQAFGTYLATGFGGAADLGYAFTIFSLPYGIFVVAIATALMPDLSEKHARGDLEGYRSSLSFGLRTAAFVTVPSAVGLISLSVPIVGLLYERGAFDARETRLVAALLVAYSVGLLGYSAYFLLVRAFYARQNTKTPAALNVVIFAFYAATAYGLSRLFEVVGIALALSAVYTVLALLGLWAMRRETKRLEGRRLLLSLAKALAAGAVMYAVAYGGTALLGTGSGAPERLAILAAVGGASLAAYLAVAYWLKAEELSPAIALIKRRFARA